MVRTKTNLSVDQQILLCLRDFKLMKKDLRNLVFDTLLELMKRNIDFLTSESVPNANSVLMLSDEIKQFYQKVFYYLIVYLLKMEDTSDKNSSFSSNSLITSSSLAVIEEFLSLNCFSGLFSMGIIPENLLNNLNSYFLALLENNAFSSAASKGNTSQFKSTTVNLVLKTIGFYPTLTSLTTLIVMIMNLITRQEHMAIILADILGRELQATNRQMVTIEVFLEINQSVVQGNLSLSSIKNMSMFIENYFKSNAKDFAYLLPIVFNILQSAAAHQLRSAVLQSFSYVLCAIQEETLVLQKDEEGSNINAPQTGEQQEIANNPRLQDIAITRDKIYDMLFERLHDVNPYTRSSLLKAMSFLVEHHALPLSKFLSLTQAVLDRLFDKNYLVRKSAIALLTMLIEHNPFSATLSKEVFEVKLQELLSAQTEEKINSEDLSLQQTFFHSAIKFILLVEEGMEKISSFFESKTLSDLTESLFFFCVAIHFQVHRSIFYYRSAFRLVWHSDPNVVKQLVSSFLNIYFRSKKSFHELQDTDNSSNFLPAKEIAFNLLKLISICDQAELISIEEIISRIVRDESNQFGGKLNKREIIHAFITFAERFSQSNARRTSLEGLRRQSSILISSKPAALDCENICWKDQLELYSMTAASLTGLSIFLSLKQPSSTPKKLDLSSMLSEESFVTLLGLGLKNQLKSPNDCDFFALKGTILITQAYFSDSKANQNTTYFYEETIIALSQILTKFIRHLSFENIGCWFSVSEEAIHTMFRIHPNPEVVMEQIIKQIYAEISQQECISMEYLCCFLFILGQTALNSMIEIEQMSKLMKAQFITNANNFSGKGTASEQGKLEEFEEQMGLSAAMDAEFDQDINNLTESNLVLNKRLDNSVSLLGEFLPLIKFAVANDSGQFSNYHLRNVSVLTLCRYMSLSSIVCEENLPLLFTILSKTCDGNQKFTEYNDVENFQLKTTILIALGDFAFRFPNVMEPWTNQLYLRLADTTSVVRYTAMMVITHLVLNDMIKVKGQISHVALALIDAEDSIKDLARLFFIKLSERSNNPLYNLLGDIISNLSQDAQQQRSAEKAVTLQQEQFHQIMHFLLSFIQKDK